MSCLAVGGGFTVTGAMGRTVLVKLAGAVRSVELMAFAGNARQRHGHHQQGENFHRGVS